MIRLLSTVAMLALAACQEDQRLSQLSPAGLIDFNDCLLGLTPVSINGWKNQVPRRCLLYAETQDMKRAIKQ